MYSYADQPTPPFNSPYQQHTSRTGSLLEPPYPPPVQQESRSNYAHGLGLYEVQSLQNGLPPSPQLSETWGGRYPNNTSTEPFADPHLSGAFDHPVTHSPVPWDSAPPSPPGSPPLYSPRAMSTAYSRDGSESVETPSWHPAVHMTYGTEAPVTTSGPSLSVQPPLTVAPERLSSNMYSYETAYPSSAIPRYEPASAYNYADHTYQGPPLGDSGSSPQTQASTSARRTNTISLPNRNRRHTDPALANFHCKICPQKGFARKYNLNQHMLTHETHRKKPHVCPQSECGKQFLRRTDLARHEQSVHSDIRPFICPKCNADFSRKDTLTRHLHDGCPRRTEIPPEDVAHRHSKL